MLLRMCTINDSNSELVMSNAFADHFSSIYSNSYNDLDAKRDFDVLCASISDDNFSKADRLLTSSLVICVSESLNWVKLVAEMV